MRVSKGNASPTARVPAPEGGTLLINHGNAGIVPIRNLFCSSQVFWALTHCERDS
jgi:hypothetical protein